MNKPFNPSMIKPVSQSTEFAVAADGKRTAKTILLEGIDKQLKLFKEPKADGRRWFTVGKSEVSLSLRVNNKPIKLVGDETKVAVPSEHFEAAMQHYKSEVQGGKFDEALAEADKGIAARKEKLQKTRAANKAAKDKPAT